MDPATRYALHAAARDGNVSKAESLLNAEPKLADVVDEDGRLPIHWAASSNSKDIVLLLSNRKNFDPDTQDVSGWTPLMIAANVKDSDAVVDILLAKGADVNQKNFRDQTILHLAASKANLDMARKLFQQKPPASARVRDKMGQYAIHRAAAAGSVPMVNLLLQQKSPLDATDADGYTALHHAVAEGHGDVAIALLKAGADKEKRTKDDQLALDLAPDPAVKKWIEREAENEGIDL